MGGRQLKKAHHKHLSEADLDDCAEGYDSNRVRKHLRRCGICSRRVRYLADDKARETLKKAQDLQGLAALALILRRIPPSPARQNDGYVDFEDEDKVRRRPWLSGAERDWLYERLPVVGIVVGLLLALIFAGTRTDPADREFAFLLVLIGAVLAFAIAVIQAIEHGEDDD